MITTVTLNAAIDKTYYAHSFRLGEVQRVVRQIAEPGGKGNNVAKVIRLLGGNATSTGFIAGSSGSFIDDSLKQRGIETSFVRVPGESRVCLNIVDTSNGISTELLEAGPTIDGKHVKEIKKTLQRLAMESSIIVLSGSLPPGAPADLYSELISMIHTSKARAYLDTSGSALRSGLLARPYLVKPNKQELTALMGRELLHDADLIEAAEKVASVGIQQVCVTLGNRGAIAFIDGEGYWVTPPLIKPVNTVGCGDSFVAGMAFADDRGDSPKEMLRIACAASAANAMSDKAGHIDYTLFQEYLKQVKVVSL